MRELSLSVSPQYPQFLEQGPVFKNAKMCLPFLLLSSLCLGDPVNICETEGRWSLLKFYDSMPQFSYSSGIHLVNQP